jgi:hypothetical protein
LAVLLVLAFCNLLHWFYLHKTYTKEEIDAFFEPITSKYGIKIVYEVDADFLTPWEESPIIEPIRHRVLVRNVDILQTALERYPVQVIKKHLSVINFAEKITRTDGFNYGGLYNELKSSIYLTDHGSQPHDDVIRTFHHEFSSLLLKRNSFEINQWADNNPRDFEYSYETTKDSIETYNNASLVGTEADYENGFMDTYGQTWVENDVNEYAAMVFTYPQKFKEIMDQYPRVRGKFLVFLEFYQNIDPIFTEEYLLGNK